VVHYTHYFEFTLEKIEVFLDFVLVDGLDSEKDSRAFPRSFTNSSELSMSDESTELVVVLDVCLGILSSWTEEETVEVLMALAASGNCLRSLDTQMPIIVPMSA